MEDGLMMRQLADSPGGLELHIGVRGANRARGRAGGRMHACRRSKQRLQAHSPART